MLDSSPHLIPRHLRGLLDFRFLPENKIIPNISLNNPVVLTLQPNHTSIFILGILLLIFYYYPYRLLIGVLEINNH